VARVLVGAGTANTAELPLSDGVLFALYTVALALMQACERAK
jgi:hypothetical protein